MRRFLLVLAAAGALLAAAPHAGAASTGALVVALPEDQARQLLGRRPAAVGIGVWPPSRDAAEFGRLLGAALGPALDASDLAVAGAIASRAADTAAARLIEHIADATDSIEEALDADVPLLAFRLADDVEAVMRLDGRPVFLIGIGERTPVLFARLDVAGSGVLAGGVARRQGVVTPDDAAATILQEIGVADAGTPGNVLTVDPDVDPLDTLDRLSDRLERDVSYPPPLTRATAGIGIGAVVLGTVALWTRQRRIAAALVRGAAMVPAGYVGALFLPDDRWEARAAVVAGAFLVGLVLLPGSARRTCGWILLLTTFGVAAASIMAASTPDAEPALSLWGNPLNSWRFFGLRNHLAAFLAGGFIVGGSLLALPAWLFAAGALAVGVVVGAPTLGANFVAVLTLGLGASVVILARAAGRVRSLHFPIGIAVGVAGTVAALAADAGSPASHGGRAVETVRSGGFDAAWGIVTRRARLNYEEIVELGVLGVVAFALAAFAIALLFAWALRAGEASFVVRAGVAGMAAAALVALVGEDSGFLVGGLMGLYPWIGFVSEGSDRLARDGALNAARDAPPPAVRAPDPDAARHGAGRGEP